MKRAGFEVFMAGNMKTIFFWDVAPYDSWQMTNLTHNSFLRIYFNSLHVSDLHTKRSPTQSDIYQMLY